MGTEAKPRWILELYAKREALQVRSQYLKDRLSDLKLPKQPKMRRKEGEFRYLELPVMLDNVLRSLEGAITTTDLTSLLTEGRNIDQRTRRLINRNVSRLLNNRVKAGRVRKIGRVQGANRAFLWEPIR